jgi:hypothetical protein
MESLNSLLANYLTSMVDVLNAAWSLEDTYPEYATRIKDNASNFAPNTFNAIDYQFCITQFGPWIKFWLISINYFLITPLSFTKSKKVRALLIASLMAFLQRFSYAKTVSPSSLDIIPVHSSILVESRHNTDSNLLTLFLMLMQQLQFIQYIVQPYLRRASIGR